MTSTIIIYRQQTRGYVYNCKIPFEYKNAQHDDTFKNHEN